MLSLRWAVTALMLCVCALVQGEDVPPWVMAGIASVETSSTYRHGMLVDYRDRRDGDAGEVSAFQLAPSVVAQWHASRSRARSDQRYAEGVARRHLCWLRSQVRTWAEAVAAYHVGLHGSRRRGADYAARVAAAGGVL